MAEARSVQYGIDFGSAGIGILQEMSDKLSAIGTLVAANATGAGDFGTALESLGKTGADATEQIGAGAEDMGAKVGKAGDLWQAAMGTAADSSKELGTAVVNATEQAEVGLRDVQEETEQVQQQIEETADEARKRFQQIGASAQGMGKAFKTAMGTGIKEGQGLFRAFKSGFQGMEGNVKAFGTKTIKTAKGFGTAFAHPISTIKGKLREALGKAADDTEEVGEAAQGAGKDLDNMGKAGEGAGGKIKSAVGGMMKAFLGLAAIKAAGTAIKNFATSAIGAFKDTEQSAAKFNAMFKDDGKSAAWADNFSKTIHRSKSEVEGFMVANKGLYAGLGATDKAATELGTVTTSLAYDLGKAFNLEDADALQKLQDGITGNAQALQDFGVKLDETTLKEKARAMGLGTDLSKIDEATMAQVRLNSIMDQTTEIQGAAAKSSTTLTGGINDIKGTLKGFLEGAGAKLAPMISNVLGVFMDAWPKLEPGLMALVEMLSDGLSQSMPVLMELGANLLPVLSTVLGTVLNAVMPLLPVIADLAKTVLPPLADVVALVAEVAMPPLVKIFDAVVPILGTLINALTPIIEALLPPLATLLEAITPILGAISPILELIGKLLTPIAEVVGKIIEWVSGGIGKVAEFFGGLFGGSKKAKEGVDEVGASVENIGSGVKPELKIDTEAYTKKVDAAAQDTSKTLSNSAAQWSEEIGSNAVKSGEAIADETTKAANTAKSNLEDIGLTAEKTASRVESAAGRMGTSLGQVGSAPSTGQTGSVPGHAHGSENFAGGWTKINERGGEMAYLPGGSKIIPADKSQQIINQSIRNERTVRQESAQPLPPVQLIIQGNPDKSTVDYTMFQLEQKVRQLYQQLRQEEIQRMSLQRGTS